MRAWLATAGIEGMITALCDLLEQHALPPRVAEHVRVSPGQRDPDIPDGYWTDAAKFQEMLYWHHTIATILHDFILPLAHFDPDPYQAPALGHFGAEWVTIIFCPALTGREKDSGRA